MSRGAGSGGLFLTQRAGRPSPSVFSFRRTCWFYTDRVGGKREPTSHTLLWMNNVNGDPHSDLRGPPQARRTALQKKKEKETYK